jgi:hypothetical protein
MQWEHRVEVFGMGWRRNERLPDAEGLQRKLNEWGADGWELVAFEVAHDEGPPPEPSDAEDAPSAVYLAILKRQVR